MPAVLADDTVDAIDDVLCSMCSNCSSGFAVHDGWSGLCPECCAVLDDHDAGRHLTHSMPGCRTCTAESDVREHFLPAIA